MIGLGITVGIGATELVAWMGLAMSGWMIMIAVLESETMEQETACKH